MMNVISALLLLKDMDSVELFIIRFQKENHKSVINQLKHSIIYIRASNNIKTIASSLVTNRAILNMTSLKEDAVMGHINIS
jgi:hypothetical protein